MKYLPRNKTESGFTLIEILVVILIIGILASIAVPVFLNQRAKANDSAVISDLKQAGMLIEAQGKFTGTIPADYKASKGVTLAAMRTSDRDNKVVSGAFINGNAQDWWTFNTSGSLTSTVVTNPTDGYQGMNYRQVKMTVASGNPAGQYVQYNAPSEVKKGESYTVGTAMRHNYTGCRTINIEFKGLNGAFVGGISSTNVCFTKDVWQYFEFTGSPTNDGVTHIVMSLYGPMSVNNTFDVTGAVIVKGDKINAAAALDTSGNDFCVVGRHENNLNKLFHYSSLDGGISEGGC